MDKTEDLTWLQAFFDDVHWTFAKTMPQFPHEYTVKEWKPQHKVSFYRAVRIIRLYGNPEPFFDKTYIYLSLNGLKYWTMGAPLVQTKIINRCTIPSISLSLTS